jgi:hypothetical protein
VWGWVTTQSLGVEMEQRATRCQQSRENGRLHDAQNVTATTPFRLLSSGSKAAHAQHL